MSDLAGLIDELAAALAPKLAAELAARMGQSAPNGHATKALITLDQLVELLPSAKQPDTWRRWLYTRLRGGNVPGATKLGGAWFFDRDTVLEWIRSGAPSVSGASNGLASRSPGNVR